MELKYGLTPSIGGQMEAKEARMLIAQKREEILMIYPNLDKLRENSGVMSVEDRVGVEIDIHIHMESMRNARKVLRQLDLAEDRISSETFGSCVDCGGKIADIRLRAIPWAKLCIACKEKSSTSRSRRYFKRGFAPSLATR